MLRVDEPYRQTLPPPPVVSSLPAVYDAPVNDDASDAGTTWQGSTEVGTALALTTAVGAAVATTGVAVAVAVVVADEAHPASAPTASREVKPSVARTMSTLLGFGW
jgi:type IV secretory pathway TrbL component